MNSPSESLQTMQIIENGGAIPATVTDVFGKMNYARSWIGSGFRYPTPVLFLNCETEVGEVQLEVHFSSFLDTNMTDNLNKFARNDDDTFAVENLVGETLYLAFENDQFHNASVGIEESQQYRDYSNVIVRTEGEQIQKKSSVDETVTTNFESVGLEMINTRLEWDYIRQYSGQNGWIRVSSVPLTRYDDVFALRSTLPGSTQPIDFTFDTTIDDLSQLKNFFTHIDEPYPPEENSTVSFWVKPIRSLSGDEKNALNTMYYDVYEEWVCSPSPTITKTDTTSNSVLHTVFEEVVRLFRDIDPFTKSTTLDVSSDPLRKAKLSNTTKCSHIVEDATEDATEETNISMDCQMTI